MNFVEGIHHEKRIHDVPVSVHDVPVSVPFPSERDRNVIADLPAGYGQPPVYKYRKGVSNEWQDIKPVSKGELIAAIKKCHQTLWGGGRLSPPAAFGEFCKIIFVKVRDEKAARRKGEPYEFQIKTDESAQALAGRLGDGLHLEPFGQVAQFRRQRGKRLAQS